MCAQKETAFNRHGKRFLCEDFKGKAAVRIRYSRRSDLLKHSHTLLCLCSEQDFTKYLQTKLRFIRLISILAALRGDWENTAVEQNSVTHETCKGSDSPF